MMNCIYCQGKCIKRGKINNVQRYQCSCCGKTQQETYSKPRIPMEKYEWVKQLNNEGCGISSIGRLLKIAKSSVQRIIIILSGSIPLPVYHEENQRYEVDELRTYCGNKKNESWVMYGINRATGKVMDIQTGRRTKENIEKVIRKILSFSPKKVYTDGLNIYPSLVPQAIHKVFEYCTNRIERHNLTLRTRLKRLARKTLCYTKSNAMLYHCVRLYCYGS